MLHLLNRARYTYWFVIGLVVSVGVLILIIWLTPRRLSDAWSTANPRWSPGGSYIATDCALRYGHFWDEFPPYELCLVRNDLSGLIRLAPDYTVFGSLQATWSPSGQELAFAHPMHGLIISGLRPGTQRVISDRWCGEPNWSPDGRQIACASGEGNITIVNVSSGQMLQLTTSGRDGTPLWANDGKEMIFHRRTESLTDSAIYLLDLTTHEEKMLVEKVDLNSQVTISSGGTQIAYPNQDDTDLIILNLQSGKIAPILSLPRSCLHKISHPQWSHDGRYIAFAAEMQSRRDGSEFYIVNVSTREIFQLTHISANSTQFLSLPSWSPDDTYLAIAFGDVRHIPATQVIIVPTSIAELAPVTCK